MYEIVKKLPDKHVTPTREMTVILARCCHCGRVREVLEQNARRANALGRKHCAVCIEETFHRMTSTRFWSIWHGMLDRTTNAACRDYPRYGGTGRGVCEEWLRFENFYRDMFPTYQAGLTLERTDNAKGYSKENCRWATNAEQQANKNNNRVLRYQEETLHLAEFCRRAHVSRGAISPRLAAGMSPEEALEDYRRSTYPKNRKSRKCTTS